MTRCGKCNGLYDPGEPVYAIGKDRTGDDAHIIRVWGVTLRGDVPVGWPTAHWLSKLGKNPLDDSYYDGYFKAKKGVQS